MHAIEKDGEASRTDRGLATQDYANNLCMLPLSPHAHATDRAECDVLPSP